MAQLGAKEVSDPEDCSLSLRDQNLLLQTKGFVKTKLLVPAVALFALAGCQTNGDMYRSDVYGSNQVNQAQQVQTVEIIAIQPARVAVNNQSDRNVSQMVGTALGGILGAVIGNQVTHHRDSGTAIGAIAGAALGAAGSSAASPQNSLVDGVQLTFKMNGRIFNSAQVGQMCEFKYGPAIMTSTGPTSTRIQPNNPYGCKR